MTILILTVGGSHQPLVTAIQSLQPDHVVFLCSDDLQTTKGSYRQVVGEELVLKSDPKLGKADLPNIVALTRLAHQRFEIRRIRNFDSLEECYTEAENILNELHVKHPNARLVADYTCGTKSMTAALALAAVDDEHCEINLVAGTRADLRMVTDGTQFARPVRVWDIRARRKLEEVGRLLQRYDYAGAAELLAAVARIPCGEVLQHTLAARIAVCRGLDAWDRCAYTEAKELLQPYRKYLVNESIMLDVLSCDQPDDPCIQVEDLLLNAERRAAQGRYDDAVARVYRAIELIAQVRLKTKYDIATADVDIQNPHLLTLSRESRGAVERYRAANGKIAVPLFAAWELLQRLGDDSLGRWFAGRSARVQSFLESRNSSILAHGMKPIDEAIYGIKGQEGLTLCREALTAIAASERKRRKVQQLPRNLPLETGRSK